ncbi:hypothetical protein K2X33_09430 [bacterium]|nr:hypothetical protein [bacterium]
MGFLFGVLLSFFCISASASSWHFSNGPEFPGAAGEISYQSSAIRLSYDFRKGGRYVAMTKALTGSPRAIGYRVKSPAGIRVKLRVVDSTGQTLQYDVNRPIEARDPEAWYRVVVDLTRSTFHFYGANDGVVHFPLKSLSFLAADAMEAGARGEVLFDGIEAYDSLASKLDLRAQNFIPLPEGALDLGSRLGVQVHFTEDDRSLDLMKTTGMRNIRMDITWQNAEKEKGVYDFSAHDRLLASLEERGFRPLFIFDYFNTLYPGSSDPGYETETIPAFARFAAAAARHFAGHPVSYEVFNEPNGSWFWPQPDARLFARLCAATTLAVKGEDPSAKVVTGGIFQFDVPYLKTFLKNGGAVGADAVGVHPYREWGAETITDEVLHMRKLVSEAAPQAELWQTEWGFPSTWYGHGHSEAAREKAARLDLREVLVTWGLGFPLMILYDDRDDGTNPADKEHNFGLIANDYAPKAALRVFQQLGRVTEERKLTGFFAMEPSTLHAMKLDGKAGMALILWSDAAKSRTSIAIPAGAVAYDMFGWRLPVSRGILEIREEAGPVYLEFR